MEELQKQIDEYGVPVNHDWRIGKSPEYIAEMETRLDNDPAIQLGRKIVNQLEDALKRKNQRSLKLSRKD
jgi:hypothetical protein